jgi:RHS repeat-associated protein
VKVTNARGAVVRIERDAQGRVVRVLHPLGLVQEIAHDAEGNVVGVRTGTRQVRFRYGGFHMLIEREEAGTRVAFERDTEGQMVAVLNEARERYGFKLDACGRVIEETGFDGKMRRYQHDAEGRVIKIRSPSGRTTRVAYDVAGRITRLDHSDGTFAEFDYRKDGAMVRATNESGTVSFERDAMARVLRETVGDIAVESSYDRAGSRISRKTSVGHETAYSFEPGGALRGVAFGMDPRFGDFSPESLRMGGPPVKAPWRATFQRDALGNETARALPGAIVAQWEHDEMSRPAMHRVSRGGIELSSVGYHFRPEGELAMFVDREKGPTRFTHDERSFLVAATRPDGSVQHRTVDITGNLFKTADRTDRRYGAGGCLNEADGTRYVHDADGNLIEEVFPDGGRRRCRWNGRGELVEVTRPDGKRVIFAYDAFGRRIRKDFEGRSTRYVWDGDDLVHEIADGSPIVTWEFEPGTFGLLAKVEGDRRYSAVTDHLGTPKALFDAQGEIVWKAELDVYGVAQVQIATTACPWRWPGQYEDEETGLYYNRFRYYDPEAGRYITQDPIRLLGGLQVYVYVSDPLRWVDPLGLSKNSCSTGAGVVDSEIHYVNLVSARRTNHILYGDATGGGHMWPGLTGKTPFPQNWSGNKIMHHVSDIATDPGLIWVQQTGRPGSLFTKSGAPARFFVIGEREGQGERMNIFLENKLETAIALNMLSEFAMVDVAIYTIL